MKKQNSLTYGIISIVMAAVSFFILGFLSISGLIVGGCGLAVSIKERKEGTNNVAGLVTNIIGLVLSAVMMFFYFKAIAKLV